MAGPTIAAAADELLSLCDGWLDCPSSSPTVVEHFARKEDDTSLLLQSEEGDEEASFLELEEEVEDEKNRNSSEGEGDVNQIGNAVNVACDIVEDYHAELETIAFKLLRDFFESYPELSAEFIEVEDSEKFDSVTENNCGEFETILTDVVAIASRGDFELKLFEGLKLLDVIDGEENEPELFRISEQPSQSVPKMKNTGVKNIYDCKICNKSFMVFSELLEHEASHVEPTLEFPCNVCGRSYRSASYLEAHGKSAHKALSKAGNQRKKKNMKSFRAKSCPDEDVLFRCDLCLKNFKSPRSLKQHKSKKHKGDMNMKVLSTNIKQNKLNKQGLKEFWCAVNLTETLVKTEHMKCGKCKKTFQIDDDDYIAR